MSKGCTHIAGIHNVTPSALGCEECLKSGSRWLHLRICRACGHVGCCDDSPNKHATAHFHATGHPVIEGYDPPEGWGWCYVDQVLFDLSNRKTPHNGRSRAIIDSIISNLMRVSTLMTVVPNKFWPNPVRCP
jgi:Zn-finger in ubiquitin-hydrolases and other protein